MASTRAKSSIGNASFLFTIKLARKEADNKQDLQSREFIFWKKRKYLLDWTLSGPKNSLLHEKKRISKQYRACMSLRKIRDHPYNAAWSKPWADYSSQCSWRASGL